MMHFLKGGNWQDGEGMDFLGFTKVINQALMEERDIEGLSKRQIRIILSSRPNIIQT